MVNEKFEFCWSKKKFRISPKSLGVGFQLSNWTNNEGNWTCLVTLLSFRLFFLNKISKFHLMFLIKYEDQDAFSMTSTFKVSGLVFFKCRSISTLTKSKKTVLLRENGQEVWKIKTNNSCNIYCAEFIKKFIIPKQNLK